MIKEADCYGVTPFPVTFSKVSPPDATEIVPQEASLIVIENHMESSAAISVETSLFVDSNIFNMPMR